MLKVSEIMTWDVVYVTEYHTISQVRHMMINHDIRHIPVVDENGFPVGLITQRDLLKSELSSLSVSDPEVGHANEAFATAAKIMSRGIKYARPEDSLKQTGHIMQQCKIGCLPVVEQGKLVGIITDSDYVGVAISLIEELDSIDTGTAE